MTHNICPHKFARNSRRPHYCTYIRVQALLDTFPACLVTADDQMLYSFLSTTVLWLNLQNAELIAFEEHLNNKYTAAQYACLTKKIKRCNTCSAILLRQLEIVHFVLADRAASLTFSPANFSDSLPFLNSVLKRSRFIAEDIARTVPDQNSALHEELQACAFQLSRRSSLFSSCLASLFTKLEKKAGLPVLPMAEILDSASIVLPARETLRRHHPQALDQPRSSNDELTFITAHQAFELWFPTMLAYIDKVSIHLCSGSRNLALAEITIRQITLIYLLFCEMIQVPQTMTAADYLVFRQQLEGGSGIESVGFRLIEISIGQRDASLIDNLSAMDLMTEPILTRLGKPSVSDTYLKLLGEAGIIGSIENLEQAALSIARILRPTGLESAHSELMAVGEALIELEQAMDSWRRQHLAMVDRMIGSRMSLGAGGLAPKDHGVESNAEKGAVTDGRPYLLQTMHYQQVFSYLWQARSLMLEKKRDFAHSVP